MTAGKWQLSAAGKWLIAADGKFKICGCCIVGVWACVPRVLKDVDGFPAISYQGYANAGENDFVATFFRRALDIDGLTWDPPIVVYSNLLWTDVDSGSVYHNADAMKQLGADATIPYAVIFNTTYWYPTNELIYSVSDAEIPSSFISTYIVSLGVGVTSGSSPFAADTTACGLVLLDTGIPALYVSQTAGIYPAGGHKFFVGADEDGPAFTGVTVPNAYGAQFHRSKVIDGKPAVLFSIYYARCQYADGLDWTTAVQTLIYVPIDWPGENYNPHDLIDYGGLPAVICEYADIAHTGIIGAGFFIGDDADGTGFTAVVIPPWNASADVRIQTGWGGLTAACIGQTGSTLTARWSTLPIPVYGDEVCEEFFGSPYCYFPLASYKNVVWESTSTDGVTWSTPIIVLTIPHTIAQQGLYNYPYFVHLYCDGGDDWVVELFKHPDYPQNVIFYNGVLVPV